MSDTVDENNHGRAWLDAQEAVRCAAWKAYQHGDVILVQQRNDCGTLNYIAQKRRIRDDV